MMLLWFAEKGYIAMSSTEVIPIVQGSIYWPTRKKYLITVWYSDNTCKNIFKEENHITEQEAIDLYNLPDIFDLENNSKGEN